MAFYGDASSNRSVQSERSSPMNSPKPDDGIEETVSWNWKMVASAAVGLLAVIFILQNTEKHSIRFLFFEWTAGTWFALLITFVLGMLVGWLLTRFLRSGRANGTGSKQDRPDGGL
jgi:uncharacterized integral membrane protein